uniref:Uncharacterized protein n=1 Tax=Chrysotila carterae TaxID=13221 RepID=A0A7S4C0N2_CHRCT
MNAMASTSTNTEHTLMVAAANQLIARTASHVNSVSNDCERRLLAIHSQMQRLEIEMRLLEFKLNSIEGLGPPLPLASTLSPPTLAPATSGAAGCAAAGATCAMATCTSDTCTSMGAPARDVGADTATHASTRTPLSHASAAADPSIQSRIAATAPSIPNVANLSDVSDASNVPEVPRTGEAQSDGEADGAVAISRARDDVRFSKYFRMLQVGVPMVMVAHKLKMETGLSPELLEAPDAPLPANLSATE